MSYTQVPPNSTGNKIDTVKIVEGEDINHRQVVQLGDKTFPVDSIAASNRSTLQVAVILAAGTGYAVDDVITLAGGTFATAAQLRVKAVLSGAITSVEVVTIGKYSVTAGTLTQGSTTGSGTGATFTCTFASDILAMFSMENYASAVIHFTAHSAGNVEVQGSGDGGVTWTRFKWFFTSFGSWSEQVGTTGSISASSVIALAFTMPLVRVHSLGNSTATVTIRATPFVSPLINQGGNSGTNQRWYTNNIISAFGSAGHNSSGGKARVISLATTNAVLLSTFLNSVYHVNLCNTGTTWAYLKFYSKSSTPTVGTDTPVAVHGIPPGGTLDINAATSGLSIYGSTQGMGYAITGAPADMDVTAIAANQVVGTIYYN